MQDSENLDGLHPELLESIDKGRRKIVHALLTGAAFVVPVMASFSKDGLNFTSEAAAAKKKTKKRAKKKRGGGSQGGPPPVPPPGPPPGG